ncbi:MAG: polymer-forming cytoskeletal protein [Gemmatimonadota bacterium]
MRLLICLLAAVLAAPLQAQELDPWRDGLPSATAERIEALLADPATVRFHGNATVPAEQVVDGAVVAEGGVLRVTGTVRGQLVTLGAELVLEPGARVLGDVLVVDGVLRGEEDAEITGSVTVYGPSDNWTRVRGMHGSADRWDDYDGRLRSRRGDADFRVEVAGNYNRVEGLPVAFGPDIRTGGRLPMRIEALAIWRTDAGPLTNAERMGYLARAEQFLPGGALRLGASLRSTVGPIEAWSVTDVEASLATAVLHEDQRDYFEREGWSAYARLAPRGSPLDAVVEYRDERHGSLAARDPWTLFSGGSAWRLQPLVGEGRIRSLHGTLSLDGVRGWDFGRRGWYAAATLEHVLDGQLTVPPLAPLPGTPGEIQLGPAFDAGYTTALLDLRRYQYAGRGGILGLRVVAGGGLEKAPLPPQFQHALGGAGSLPGYSFFSADCGARALVGTRGDGPGEARFHPAYGCDRFGLVQAEYRGGFDLHFGGRDHREGRARGWRHHDFDVDVDWTVFFDAGRGYAYAADGRTAGDTGTLYDVGAGIVLGDVGIYGAAPLTGTDRDLRFFVRLGPRF